MFTKWLWSYSGMWPYLGSLTLAVFSLVLVAYSLFLVEPLASFLFSIYVYLFSVKCSWKFLDVCSIIYIHKYSIVLQNQENLWKLTILLLAFLIYFELLYFIHCLQALFFFQFPQILFALLFIIMLPLSLHIESLFLIFFLFICTIYAFSISSVLLLFNFSFRF